MKSKKIVIAIIVCIAIIIICLGMLISTILGTKVSKKPIIKSFNQNIDAFNSCVEKLDEDYIYFKRENNGRMKLGKIIISIHRYENGKIKVIKLDEQDYGKYQKIIDLMEELKIKYVLKSKDNIQFLFNAGFRISQAIVNLQDENMLIKDGYEISYKEKLYNNWYYVELE